MAKSQMATAGSPARPPSRLPATRESRPALIGLAVILIVGGALASAWLAVQSGNRAYFLQIDEEVAQGATISDSDVSKVSLPEDFSGGIPSDQVDDIIGKAAATRLLPGTVLTADMVSSKAGIADGKTQLTVPADSSPFISTLQPGAQMALSVGSSADSGRESVAAELVSVGDDDDGDVTGAGDDSVSLVVSIDVSCLSAVSQAIEDKSVTPALIGGDNPAVSQTCGG